MPDPPALNGPTSFIRLKGRVLNLDHITRVDRFESDSGPRVEIFLSDGSGPFEFYDEEAAHLWEFWKLNSINIEEGT